MIGRVGSVLARRSYPAVASLAAKATTTTVNNNNQQLLSLYQRKQNFSVKVEESADATQAYKKSCYFEIDFTIPEESSVYEAVQKFAAFDIGCLVVVDAKG